MEDLLPWGRSAAPPRAGGPSGLGCQVVGAWCLKRPMVAFAQLRSCQGPPMGTLAPSSSFSTNTGSGAVQTPPEVQGPRKGARLPASYCLPQHFVTGSNNLSETRVMQNPSRCPSPSMAPVPSVRDLYLSPPSPTSEPKGTAQTSSIAPEMPLLPQGGLQIDMVVARVGTLPSSPISLHCTCRWLTRTSQSPRCKRTSHFLPKPTLQPWQGQPCLLFSPKPRRHS